MGSLKKKPQITQMRLMALLRSSHLLFVARHPAQSWAGGVAVASATANAREAPTHPLSCTSFASIFSCVCDNDP
ncbi:MAG TPA: hypothetical protein O0X18_09740, partial [Methanocorpusculum sp.]|nr:hypothetical protein [Methanocorpusculum sp.]